MTLSACSTTLPTRTETAIIEVRPVPVIAPTAYTKACPPLPTISVPPDVWQDLTGQQQIQILLDHVGRWSVSYQECKQRHEALTDWLTNLHQKESIKNGPVSS